MCIYYERTEASQGVQHVTGVVWKNANLYELSLILAAFFIDMFVLKIYESLAWKYPKDYLKGGRIYAMEGASAMFRAKWQEFSVSVTLILRKCRGALGKVLREFSANWVLGLSIKH